MKILIAYGTTDGQTAEIADYMGARLRASGHDVLVADVRVIPRTLALEPFDHILIGASMHAQGYQRRVRRFIRRNLAALNAAHAAFFSVCMAIASKDPASRAEARAIPQRFVEKLGWRPSALTVIAGAVRFSRYGFLRRPIMRTIVRKELGSVDDTRDLVYTDWTAVDGFVGAFTGGLPKSEVEAHA